MTPLSIPASICTKCKYTEVIGDEEEASKDIPADMPPVLSASVWAWKKVVILYLMDPEVDPSLTGRLSHPKVGGKYEWIGNSEIGVLYESTLSDV